jgi:hypothetical protein
LSDRRCAHSRTGAWSPVREGYENAFEEDETGDEGNSGPGSSHSGHGPSGHDDNGTGANCTRADLIPGATIEEVELELEHGVATFEEVELAG